MKQASIKIDSGEIHIWTELFSAHADTAGRMESILSPAEMQRAESFRFRDDRTRYISSHGLLRCILSRYSGLEPRDIRFTHGPHGKPHWACEGQLYFSLSHTRAMMAVAVTSESEVGIDIEKKDEMKDMEDVAGQFMAADEFRHLHSLAEHARKNFFYECWTRKEALMKAAGIGLGDHMRRTSVIGHLTGTDRRVPLNGEGYSGPWWLETFHPAPHHVGAVCAEALPLNKDYAIRFQRIDPSARFD